MLLYFLPTAHVPGAVLDIGDTAMTDVHVLTNHPSPNVPHRGLQTTVVTNATRGMARVLGDHALKHLWKRGVREFPGGFADSLYHSANIYDHLLCARPQSI